MQALGAASSQLVCHHRLCAPAVDRSRGRAVNGVSPCGRHAPPDSCSCSAGFLHGSTLVVERKRRSQKARSLAPPAVIATDPAVEVVKEFALEGGARVKVKWVGGSNNGDSTTLELQVLNYTGSGLVLHWGAVAGGRSGWMLPESRPPGTRDYKGKALQTSFQKQGDADFFLAVEVVDPEIEALEFLLKDKDKDSWFKLKGGNFRVDVPQRKAAISIPEELVQVQAYLRWERRGKQNYSPEQEKAEYEEARKELQEEAARGVSVDGLRARLVGGEGGSGMGKEEQVLEIPDDLVQVQSYLRWEKAGKPNFSQEEQLREFEEARKDLQKEVRKGKSVDDLRKRFADKKSDNGGAGAAIPKKAGGKAHQQQRVQRKNRDVSEIINRFAGNKGAAVAAAAAEVADPAPAAPRKPSALDGVMEGGEGEDVILRKAFKIGGGKEELLVVVRKEGGDVKVGLASNMKEDMFLHWGVSKASPREWSGPAQEMVPAGSNLGPVSCETPFQRGFGGDEKLQGLELGFGDGAYIGMPFVLRVGGSWYKDESGSDFYIPLGKQKKVQVEVTGKVAKGYLDEVAGLESEAERSLMHRYGIAAGLAERARREGELAMAGLLVWLRFMASRQLTWNRNYNVKPREISAAQDKLTKVLGEWFKEEPESRELVRLMMASVGRGGQGDVGQRIRDEILVIQRNNDCAGGMMEEWHQKLHNNSSPDDVVICEALLDFIQADFDMQVYWKTLTDAGISKQRLASYDRPIVSEPKLRADQRNGLIRDLTAYLKTLKAVHSGADLESAIETCMGYRAEGKGFMGGLNIHPISGLSPQLPPLLSFVMEHVQDAGDGQTVALMEGLLEARWELRPTLHDSRPHDRFRDIIFLDLALDSTVRTAVERGLESFKKASSPSELLPPISLLLENLCLSVSDNEELVYCLKDWYRILKNSGAPAAEWALRAKAVLDRTRLALAHKALHYQDVLQPSAEYLGAALGVEKWAVDIFTEEIIRAGSAASLSQLLNQLDPLLRACAHMGSWQVISPVEVRGFIQVVPHLAEVEDKRFTKPTVLVSATVKGEEEIPDGAVALLTPDMPDVLSHVSVRARNCNVCFATCFDPQLLADLTKNDGKAISIQLKAGDLVYTYIPDSQVSDHAAAAAAADGAPPPQHIVLKKKQFAGKYAVPADEFNPDLVGAKSRNIANLRGKLPTWIRLPTSVALPFGTFEKVLGEKENKEVADEIAALTKVLQQGDFHRLKEAREVVLKLKPPAQLIQQLKATMKGSNMPWPGDEGEQRWEQAWTAIKKVWGSKWNERAYFSTRKAGIDHSDLCMAVLVQEVIQADYAFVIHTVNPSNGEASEIYAEVVKGLGETLVGAYSGRALSFVTNKSDLKSPRILGYPSKRIGLFIKQSVIFRSDSNGEDLEGYAGAGLYDSVPMDREEERVVDYSTDQLLQDLLFQKNILVKIAEAGAAVEKLLGSAQDIEGVIKNGELYIVQTRPQM